MARTKQTARKDTGGKPLAMGRGRGKGNSKKDPMTGGRVDRKVVLEYSSDEDENNPQLAGSRGTKAREEADSSHPANESSPTSLLPKPLPPFSLIMA